MDMVDHPPFWDGPSVLCADTTTLIDDEGLRYAIDPKVDAGLTSPVHSVRKSLTELVDERLCGYFAILNIHSDHDHATLPVALPHTLEPRRFLIAGWEAPRCPEIYYRDPSAKSLGVDDATIK